MRYALLALLILGMVPGFAEQPSSNGTVRILSRDIRLWDGKNSTGFQECSIYTDGTVEIRERTHATATPSRRDGRVDQSLPKGYRKIIDSAVDRRGGRLLTSAELKNFDLGNGTNPLNVRYYGHWIQGGYVVHTSILEVVSYSKGVAHYGFLTGNDGILGLVDYVDANCPEVFK